MSNIDSAIAFAATAHAGQKRKWSNVPYIVHPLDVLQIMLENASMEVDEEMQVAAVLHDVVEDTIVKIEAIKRRFGKTAAGLVMELTDQFTQEAYPDKNRATRKAMERERLANISAAAQTIKYADLISNTGNIIHKDPGFARVYLVEKEHLLATMLRGDEGLRQMAFETLAEAQIHLVNR